MSSAWVSRVESGEHERPSMEYLSRVADALRVKVEHLARDQEPPIEPDVRAQIDELLNRPGVSHHFVNLAGEISKLTDEDAAQLLEVMLQMAEVADRRRGNR